MLVPGLLAAALLVTALLGALRWLLAGVVPGSGRLGAVAGGVLDRTVAACVAALILIAAGLPLLAALRRGRLK